MGPPIPWGRLNYILSVLDPLSPLTAWLEEANAEDDIIVMVQSSYVEPGQVGRLEDALRKGTSTALWFQKHGHKNSGRKKPRTQAKDLCASIKRVMTSVTDPIRQWGAQTSDANLSIRSRNHLEPPKAPLPAPHDTTPWNAQFCLNLNEAVSLFLNLEKVHMGYKMYRHLKLYDNSKARIDQRHLL